jgi:DNA-binding transcriptional LysR family regulator
MFDWNDLRYFLAVAREGSTLAAARKLQVNQSTVHRRLVALEKALGCSLVERHPTGYRLTELGNQLRSHAERVEEDIGALRRRIAASDRGMIGRIRMTCSTAVGHRLMRSGLLDAFTRQYPGLNVELVMTERLLSLAAGDADAAIRGGVPTDETLVGKRIANVPWALYATRAYIDRYGRPGSVADLDKHTTVGFIEAMANHNVANWLRRHAPHARICAEAGNIPSVFLAVKSGACLAPLPVPLGDGDDELQCVLGPVSDLSYPMYLLTHRDMRRVPRINAFFDFCAGKLRPILTKPRT